MVLKKLYYSLDEASLILANLSPEDVESVAKARSGNYTGWQDASHILAVLTELVEASILPTKHNQVVV